MNQFCLRVSMYHKLWKGKIIIRKKKKNSYNGQTTQHHCYRKLEILPKLIVSLHIHTFPWRMWNQGVALVSLLILGIRIPTSVSKSGPCPEGHSKALVVSRGAACPAGAVSGAVAVGTGCPCWCSALSWAQLSDTPGFWDQASQLPGLFGYPCVTAWFNLPSLWRASKRWRAD